MFDFVIIAAVLSPPPCMDDVQVYVALDAGVAIDLEFADRAAGRVGFSAHIDEHGDGGALLFVDDAPTLELAFEAGEIASILQAAPLGKGESRRIGEGILELWRGQCLEDALENAADGNRWKCWLAGAIAGKVAGVLAAGACGAVAGPLAAGCAAPAALADVTVSGYVSNKCNQAQNT